jgi:hypothetical protein
MRSTATKQTVIVTKDELAEIAEWESALAKAKKKVSDAEKEVRFRRIQLAEKVLGVNSEDELKELAPSQVLSRYHKRLDAGDWKLERGAPSFAFSKTNEGRYPSWGKLFIDEMGETAAAKIKAETPLTYSYCVEVAAE